MLTDDFRSRTNQKTGDVKEDTERERTMETEREDGLALYERELNFYLELILRS